MHRPLGRPSISRTVVASPQRDRQDQVLLGPALTHARWGDVRTRKATSLPSLLRTSMGPERPAAGSRERQGSPGPGHGAGSSPLRMPQPALSHRPRRVPCCAVRWGGAPLPAAVWASGVSPAALPAHCRERLERVEDPGPRGPASGAITAAFGAHSGARPRYSPKPGGQQPHHSLTSGGERKNSAEQRPLPPWRS